MHRKSEEKLFTQRFKTKAILSEEHLKQVIQEIQRNRDEFAACCMMSETMSRYDWMKPYNPIIFIQPEISKKKLSIDDVRNQLNDLLVSKELNINDFKKNKTLRNEWIKDLRQKYDCNLKCLAEVLGLTESSVSKIINTVEQ